jgi:hypothetical protein
MMAGETSIQLELDDIQSGVLRPRPTPYAATYILFEIEDRSAGRKLMRRAADMVASAANPTSPAGDTWISVSLTFEGLKALGVPKQSLDSFAWEFRQGMVARALGPASIRFHIVPFPSAFAISRSSSSGVAVTTVSCLECEPFDGSRVSRLKEAVE